ncbi:hypothetical protein, partial [Roseibium sp.]|uniref:hypothetical protein n=1 Tax=Roseibium sp. TaxID=1936156 RepID=UPI003519B54A
DMTRPHQKALCPTHWHKKSLILLPQPNKKKAALLGGLFCWITCGRAEERRSGAEYSQSRRQAQIKSLFTQTTS